VDKDTREQIALIRYKLISPVLAEPGRVQNDYFRKQAAKLHVFPHYGSRKVAVSTMKAWLKQYKQKGFEALKPKCRRDAGRPRRIDKNIQNAIRARCKAYPYLSVQKLYEQLLRDNLLGDPVPVHYNTVLRLIKQENLLDVSGTRKDVRKRFEVAQINELWIADFMHGPQVLQNHRSQKAILCAIIDDHSRMIVGHGFAASETVLSLTHVLKDAFMAYGLPKRLYVDNGAAFSSDFLAKSCALAGVSLIHSKPYDSPSRGKIERFFRTLRSRFLADTAEKMTLEQINDAFAAWLKDDYHHRLHSGIDERPIDRYHRCAAQVDIRRLSRAELDEIFLVRHERVVNNDATISFKGRIYEVPAAYIRQRVEIRHPVGDERELFLYDYDCRVAKLRLVDVRENARLFRPQRSTSLISFAEERVRK
jgi:putative transposase